MKNDISLFIGGREIDFSTDPKILFNYKITDVNNPAVVKNSYSKTIEIEGTPNNNDVFQNIWNLQRIQYAGIDFNPIKKTDFTIYVNGDIYERGYAKLDGITRKNNKYVYSVTLFGGLGDFFFKLSYNDSDGDDKKTLADLNYAFRESYGDGIGIYGNTEPDLNFYINKDTLWDAWGVIRGSSNAVYDEGSVNRPSNYLYDNKWKVINFAPCYNGLPEDFDTSKFLINTKNMPVIRTSYSDGGVMYGAYNGYLLGEQPNDELTEWETFDLRSYLQRPVVSMKRIIDACCNPINNGGYEVRLDPTFFQYDNPYYDSAYLTLGMLREIKEGGETYIYKNPRLLYQKKVGDTSYYEVQYTPETMVTIDNVKLDLILEFITPVNVSLDRTYLYRNFKADASDDGDTQRVKSIKSIGSISMQLLAYNNTDECVGASAVYFIVDEKAKGKVKFENDTKWDSSDAPYGRVETVYGYFRAIQSDRFALEDANGNPMMLNFSFGNDVPYTRLVLKVLPITKNYIEYYNPYKWWKGRKYNDVQKMEDFSNLTLFKYDGITYGGDITISQAKNRESYAVTTDVGVANLLLSLKDYSEFYSNTFISKEDLLNSDKTPADYLISYAKMFGLYFYSDPSEVASNPDLAPNGVIHILTRDSYYTQEIVDLEEFIDTTKDIKITPTVPDSKWINFNIEQVDSQANKEYKDQYGYDYGYKKINTGFNFNTDNKAVLDKVVYKGGVDVLETSKYYQKPIDGYPAYGWNGFTYNLFATVNGKLESKKLDDGMGMIPKWSISPKGWENTDAFKKPQFHESDNDAAEGKDVLLFNIGTTPTLTAPYWITDDLNEMISLNDGKPCWIMTAEETNNTSSRKIAYKINYLPQFERSITAYVNGVTKHSWDMGNPMMTFVRDTYAGPKGSIYTKCWDKYITDMYDQNNRILTCSVRFNERPNSGWLRKFYWFDNSIWRLNTIKDWNITSYEPTVVEFIKVIDTNNYRLDEITSTIVVSFTFKDILNVDNEYGGDSRNHYYRISGEEQDVKAIIDVGDAGSWSFSDNMYIIYEDTSDEYVYYEDYMTPTNTSGSGNAVKTFHFPENDSGMYREFRMALVDDEDRWYNCTVIQDSI